MNCHCLAHSLGQVWQGLLSQLYLYGVTMADLPDISDSADRCRQHTEGDVAWRLCAASIWANNIISDQYCTYTYREHKAESGHLPVRGIVPVRTRAHLLLGCLAPRKRADNGTRKHVSPSIVNALCPYIIPRVSGADIHSPGSLYHDLWAYRMKWNCSANHEPPNHVVCGSKYCLSRLVQRLRLCRLVEPQKKKKASVVL